MKRILATIILLAVHQFAWADELCANWERKIAPDMQIEESEFTSEAATGALDYLEKLIIEPRHELSAFAEQNALKIVQGWLLKKAALESIQQYEYATPGTELPEVRMFCTFLVEKAFYHD